LRMADVHADMQGFDFHTVILATDETQMKHGFFRWENRPRPRSRSRPRKIMADNAAKRARLIATK
jgi:hypothetical protein